MHNSRFEKLQSFPVRPCAFTRTTLHYLDFAISASKSKVTWALDKLRRGEGSVPWEARLKKCY